MQLQVHFLNILTSLIEKDKWLFEKLNSQWTNSFFDFILPFFRSPVFWAPLYLFLLVFVAANKKKNVLWWIVLFICTAALTDLTGTNVFKQHIDRLRPCADPLMVGHVRFLLKECTGIHQSFLSNHAANHFGMATFFFVTMRHSWGKWCALAFLWAASVAYAQVYVGVHYPLDVFCGALLGILLGLFTGMIFNKRFGFAIFDKEPTITI